MKKLFVVIIAVILFSAVLAEDAYEKKAWNIYQIEGPLTLDFDGDETAETVNVSFALNEYDDGAFTLSVGESSLTVKDCVSLQKKLYAMKLGDESYWYATLFMVNEYGPSDDPITYCFIYSDGRLSNIGMIPALVDSFSVSEDGVVTTSIRADMIGTWSRPADYSIAQCFEYSEDSFAISYAMIENPRALYPMNMIVTLKKDIVLSSSVYATDATVQMKAGLKVVLSASDDVSRLCISELNGRKRGWMSMKQTDWQDSVLVDGKYIPVDEVFDGIFYAD